MASAHRDLSVEHAIPGRLRVKYHPLKSNPDLAGRLHGKLSAIDGVTHVDTHPANGGVIVHYHPDAAESIEFFLKIAAAFGLAAADINVDELEEWYHLLSGGGPGASVEESLASVGTLVEDGLAALSRREWTLSVVLPAVLCLLGVRSLVASPVLKAPDWYEYFWFAFGAYYALNKPESPGDAAGLTARDMPSGH